MGFFKKLFKRKKGGTFLGNLFRGVVNKASGGLLGNGRDLRRWEAKQEQKELEKQQKMLLDQQRMQRPPDMTNSDGFRMGAQIGGKINPRSAEAPTASQTSKIKKFLKEKWYFVVGGAALIVGLIVVVPKMLGKKRKKGGLRM
jgi:hypothetical protein